MVDDEQAVNARCAAEASAAGDLAGWLRAVVAEVRRVALGCGDEGARTWTWSEPYGESVSAENGDCVAVGPWDCGVDQDYARHIVLHDPRAVLDQCEAVENLLDVHEPYRSEEIGNRERCQTCGTPADPWPCITLRCVAVAYRRWPGYRAEWKP